MDQLQHHLLPHYHRWGIIVMIVHRKKDFILTPTYIQMVCVCVCARIFSFLLTKKFLCKITSLMMQLTEETILLF